jgi:hypothetical protein
MAAKQLLALTGGRRMRIAYSRWGAKGDPSKTGDTYPGFKIMVFDTSERHERELLTGTRCQHPLITPTGKRVIYDELTYHFKENPIKLQGRSTRMYVVDWDGRNERVLGDAFKSMGVAEDPPGTEWVYFVKRDNGSKVWRLQIDNPSVTEVVWDNAAARPSWYWAFTRDGKRACGGLPWPQVHVMTLPKGSYQKVGGGCGEGMCPDGVRAFHFVQDHAGVMMYDKPGAAGRYINFRNAPDVNGSSVLYPAWARYDERIFSFCGPQHKAPACVIIGRFNKNFTDVEAWVKVTDSPTIDVAAYAWIGDPAEAPRIVTQPKDQTAAQGETVTFTVEAAGDPEPTYQWRKDGAKIAGATKASYSVTASRDVKGARFTCVVKNSKGRLVSGAAMLTVHLKGPSPEQLAEWDAKLLARLRESLKSGVRPAMKPESRRNRREVSAISHGGTLSVQMSRGMEIGMPLERITAEDKAQLIQSVLRKDSAADHALAALYLLSAGDEDAAKDHLGAAGKDAETIRSMFK